MYSNVKETFHENAFGMSREISVRAVFNRTTDSDGTELDGDYIKDIAIEEVISADGPTIGSTCSNKATINMYMPEPVVPLINGWIDLYVGIPNECPLGRFYVADVVTKDKYKTVTVTAYDKMGQLGKPYTPSSSMVFPAKIAAVVGDIAEQNGFQVDYDDFPDYEIPLIESTEREMLGYCAGLMGKNAKFNRDGKLTFVWFTDAGMSIPPEVQYQNGFSETTAERFILGGLISGTEETPLTAGSGRTITFSNPFMTQEILDNILAAVQGFSYTPCEVKYRCDPSFETGDIVAVVSSDGSDTAASYSIPIMAQTIKIGGGMNATIYAYGMSETSETLAKSPSKAELNRVKKSLEEYVVNLTKNITGQKGGYYNLTYSEDGSCTGWTIMDTPTLTPTTKMWIMSSGGLGFSDDGGETISKLAFDLDGHFYADCIMSGSISAELLNIKEVQSLIVTAQYINALRVVAKSIDADSGRIGGFDINPHGLRSSYDNTCAIYDFQNNPFSRDLKIQALEGHSDIGLLTDFFDVELLESYSIQAESPSVDWPYNNFKASAGEIFYMTNITKFTLKLVAVYSNDKQSFDVTSVVDIANTETSETMRKYFKYVAFGFKVVATGKRVYTLNESSSNQGDYTIDFFSDTYANVDATLSLLSTTYKPKLVLKAIQGGNSEITPLLFRYGSFVVNCLGEVFVEDTELEKLWSKNMA